MSSRVFPFVIGILLFGCVHAQAPALVTFEDLAPLPEWLRPSRGWSTVEYHPYGTSVRGIPIRKLNEGLCKANELSPSDFPEHLWKDYRDIGHSVSVSGRFVGNRNIQTALIGAYETCEKEKGLFLLIVENSRNRHRVLLFEKYPNEVVMTLGVADKRSIQVMWCIGGCDHGTTLHWDTKKRKFVMDESPPEPEVHYAQPFNPPDAAR